MAHEASALTVERLAKGLSYRDYVASVKINKEGYDERYAQTQLSEDDKRFFADLNRRLGRVWVLAITEDWCTDSYNNLPVVQRIVEAAGNMDLRIFPRDENLDLMNQYLTNNCMSIPMIAFFDENLKELGRWVERPAAVSKFIMETRTELSQKGLSQEELLAELRKRMATTYQTISKGDTVREIKEVLTK
ncbi:MAG: thioredoxin family protein [Chloroflexi bacterium]|nr:thioredoxin family protein [Chloroflexota bacterium]